MKTLMMTLFAGVATMATANDMDACGCGVQVKQLMKDAKCTDITFKVEANSDDCKTTGKYAVCMLDTRNCAKEGGRRRQGRQARAVDTLNVVKSSGIS